VYLVESDLTYALALSDPFSSTAERIFTAAAQKRIELAVCSLSFQEMDSVIKANQVDVDGNPEDFFHDLAEKFADHGIAQEPMLMADTAQSIRFRKRYGLTYFDSYHAACAFRVGATLLSFDRAYLRVREIKYRHPDDLLRELDSA